MQGYEQAVFISYAWGGEREEAVNQIDKALQQRGIKIIRDKRDLGYKGSITGFMERIGKGNCVIVVISDKYLRSPNCMFELVEIAENKGFHDRIFPIVLADADIYDPVKRIEYVKHWELKRAELAQAMKSLDDPANLQGIREDMDLYDRIRDKVSGLTSIFKDMNTLTPEMHQDSNFSVLFDVIEKRMKEGLTIPAIEVVTGVDAGAVPTTLTSAPAAAAGGLMALRDLMQRSPVVRNAVNGFRNDFKSTHEQVNLLGDYKDLHDQLHKLQFHCYNGVVQAATRFPDDDLTLDSLTDHALTLEGIFEELKQIATSLSIPKQDLMWIDEVGLSKIDLRNAVDNLDQSALKKVIWRLNRLLTIQPARVNALLNFSAHALHLSELLSALESVSNTLITLELDTSQVNSFQSGITAFNELNRSLSALIDDHDHWQALDVELRRIEASIERDLFEFEMSWPDIKLKAGPLYIDNPEDWASALKRESDILEEECKARNPLKVRRSFRSYQRRVTDRFYRVDVQLKALCSDMRQIGMPLAAVMEMIYDYS
jgi:hypothetical protein